VVDRLQLPTDPFRAALVCLDAPLPAGEPTAVRAAGSRALALSYELRRAATALLTGSTQLGWSGSARDAFVSAMHNSAPKLDASASRYAAYASTLRTYAESLELLIPALRSSRTRVQDALDQAKRPRAAATAAGHLAAPISPGATIAPAQVGDPDLEFAIGAFRARHDDWVDAVHCCTRALSRANAADPTRDLHGWAALASEADHALQYLSPVSYLLLHPSLANLSNTLSILQLELTAVAIAFLFVFPPAAAVCFAAAAALSAVQFAVDLERRDRGQAVSNLDLGLSAIGAVPLIGRVASEAEAVLRGVRPLEAAEKSVPIAGAWAARVASANGVEAVVGQAAHGVGARAADRPAEDSTAAESRVIPLVPAGGLATHESRPGTQDLGHTLARHVRQTDAGLLKRLKNPLLKIGASRFYNEQDAEVAITEVLDCKISQIRNWLATSKPSLVLSATSADVVGRFVDKATRQFSDRSEIRVILIRSPALAIGYFILTSYMGP
jgi:hypothetical protein